jgi:hypothetical protein
MNRNSVSLHRCRYSMPIIIPFHLTLSFLATLVSRWTRSCLCCVRVCDDDTGAEILV